MVKRIGRRGRQRDAIKSLKSETARARALEAVNLMRRKGISFTRAARVAQTTPATLRKYVASALRREPNGRIAATPTDRLYRELRFLNPEGQITVGVRGSRKAETIARYWAAVHRYLDTGETDALEKFQGKSIKVGQVTYPFVTDLGVLDILGEAGEFSFEDLYAVTG